MKPDLNCDLGEGEPRARTASLLRWITSANLACGGHAGDLASMRAALRLAKRHGVRVGAHPGPPARGDFGRGAIGLGEDELELLLLQQVGSLARLARAEGVALRHIKLHGALYHATDTHPALAMRYVVAARRWWPQCVLYARAGGLVERVARQRGVRCWGEMFADRGYCDDGTLVPRTEPGALLTDPRRVRARVDWFRRCGQVETQSGRFLKLSARTICVHSDTPGAALLARTVAEALR